MVTSSGGKASLGVDYLLPYSEFPPIPSTLPSTSKVNSLLTKEKTFADSLNDNEILEDNSLMKEITYVEGIPQVEWTEQEVIKITHIEKLQFVVIGKLSYEWTDLEELRR
uniref:Uncharacterized protein n=1 Tax=Solanum tuberosum TaxID=4113 RepID=M1DS09_SOLTU